MAGVQQHDNGREGGKGLPEGHEGRAGRPRDDAHGEPAERRPDAGPRDQPTVSLWEGAGSLPSHLLVTMNLPRSLVLINPQLSASCSICRILHIRLVGFFAMCRTSLRRVAAPRFKVGPSRSRCTEPCLFYSFLPFCEYQPLHVQSSGRSVVIGSLSESFRRRSVSSVPSCLTSTHYFPLFVLLF